MGIFVQDTFTGAADTLLTSHAGEVGGWVPRSFTTGGDNTLYTKLDGNGNVYASNRNTITYASGCSNVVAPQLDMYESYSLLFGAVPPNFNSFDTLVQFFEHTQPSGAIPNNSGFSITVGDHDYAVVSVPSFLDVNSIEGGEQNHFLPPILSGSSHTGRAEYFFSTGTFNFFWDGNLICKLTAPAYTPSSTEAVYPTAPGLFAFRTRHDSALTPTPVAIDYVEVGTIAPPPSAFWTDFAGPIEVVQ
jgi:hypothetical protein